MELRTPPPARTPLLVNGWFSLGTGLLLALAPSTVGGWLGVEIDGWLRMLGLVLIGHFGLLMWMARRPEPMPWAKVNLMMIAPYPMLMIALVATGFIDKGAGQVLVLLDGAIVALIAAAHWLALREATPIESFRPV